ncbi:MAG: TRAM domain-containing protein [Acidobacteriota bacterium]
MTDPPAARMTAGARLAELDVLELTIDKLIAGGEGIGRFEGIPIFVPRSAPQDRLRVRLVERRTGYGRAEILEVLQPSPARRQAPCPHFEPCGGCDLQHIDDAQQVRYKAEAVLDTLGHLSGLDLPPPRIYADQPWGYRLRTQIHTRVEGDRRPRVGYYARGTQKLVPVDACPVLLPVLENQLQELPAALSGDAPRRIDWVAGDDGQVSSAPVVAGLPQGPVGLAVETAVGKLRYVFDARCFFQGHRGLLGELIDVVIGEWQGDQAFDLYAGVGLFSVPLARRYRRVTAVEGDRVAVRYARRNLRQNQIVEKKDGEARQGKVVAYALDSWVKKLPAAADRVIVDPPRQGLQKSVRWALRRVLPARLTYVSCHPATLARDLQEFDASYRVESLALFDLFPQTGHMEAVVQLARRSGAEPVVDRPFPARPRRSPGRPRGGRPGGRPRRGSVRG